VDSDIPLKVAFRVRARDLLPLTGDRGARVVSALTYVLPAVERTVGLVLRLRRGDDEYLRHLEFQTSHRGDVASRCFEYASRLALRFRLPVLTTVLYLRSGPRGDLVYRHRVGGRVVNEWRFDVVRLWKESPERLLALGPGGAALVPLSSTASLPVIAEASRKIRREAPEGQQVDLLAILQVFAEGRYTARQLARVIPEEVAMDSVLFDKVRVKAQAEGRAQEARQMCVEMAKALHPAVASRLIPAIEACSNLTRLRRWALRAPGVSDAEFARLVIGRSGSTRRRAPRPARKAVRASR
jgi:hypothetical protein